MLRYALLLCSLSILLIGCHKKEKPAPPTPTVTDFVLETKNVPAIFNYVGFAESTHPVEIQARVQGYLDKIAYDEGQLVNEGDLLFQLDPRQFQAAVEQAKGEVLRQEAILENAKLTVNRLTPLYQQKAASKKDLDNATSQELAAAAALQSAKANLLNAEINLDYTTIRSPITGYASKAKYREGALITPGQNGLLTTVSVLDPIWIYFTVSDNDVLRARQQEAEHRITLPFGKDVITMPMENGWQVQAVLSDGSVLEESGKLNYSSPTYDQATGTMQARAVFSNPKGILRPGQFVQVRLLGAERPNALYVPQRAVMQKKGGQYVYMIKEDDTVVAQDISTGEWFDDYMIVNNGLKVGDRIVVDGINKVRPNVKVQVTGLWTPPQKKSDSTPSPQ